VLLDPNLQDHHSAGTMSDRPAAERGRNTRRERKGGRRQGGDQTYQDWIEVGRGLTMALAGTGGRTVSPFQIFRSRSSTSTDCM
jgi:hypothetical protein